MTSAEMFLRGKKNFERRDVRAEGSVAAAFTALRNEVNLLTWERDRLLEIVAKHKCNADPASTVRPHGEVERLAGAGSAEPKEEL